MARQQTRQDKKAFLEALEKKLGIITEACKATGIPRSRIYQWINKDKTFRENVDAVGEVACDFAESKLFTLIREGNPAATIFFAKTRMRHRGYAERVEVSGPDGAALQVTVNISENDQSSDPID